MSQEWEVIQNAGVLMTLERDSERIYIWCPRFSFDQELFLSLRPGDKVDNSVVELFQSYAA